MFDRAELFSITVQHRQDYRWKTEIFYEISDDVGGGDGGG